MASKLSSGRAAKPQLDREVFIQAALRLASRPQMLSVTYRELGEELGVDPTAVYRHFLSKEVLMQELLDRIYRMANAKVTVPTSRWEDCLAEFAKVTLETFLEYPAIAVTATSLTTNGPGELDSIELMVTCFAASGLSGRALAEQYAAFGSYVLSGAAGLAREYSGVEDSESLKWFTGPLLADAQRHPMTALIREDILDLDHREMFLAGVDKIIQAARITARR